MLQKIGRGLRLRCPNCGIGALSDSLFTMRDTCANCGVRFERKSGESAGAALIWVSVLPLLALALFFILDLTLLPGAFWLSGTIAMVFLLILGLVGYRHVRGLWIAITDLTGGLYADRDRESQHDAS